MPVSTTESGVVVYGDGTTVEFFFNFGVASGASVKAGLILLSGVEELPTLDYTVTLNTETAGGTVLFEVPPASGQPIYIFRVTPRTQLVGVTSQNKYDPRVVQAVWDKLTYLVQELEGKIVRALLVPPGAAPETLLVEVFGARDTSLLSAEAAESWAVNPLPPAGPDTMSAKTGAEIATLLALSLQSVTDAAEAAVAAVAGKVTGPVGAVANRIAVFDGTTGKLLADGGVLVSDLAPLVSPALTGTPTAPTAAPGTNTTQLATMAAVQAAVPLVSTGAKGMAPATGAATGRFLRDDATWASASVWGYESAALTITYSAAQTLTHGLGAHPTRLAAFIECLMADGGFSVGQRIQLDSYQNWDLSRGFSLITTATQIIAAFGTGLYLVGPGGVSADLTASRWRLYVKASL